MTGTASLGVCKIYLDRKFKGSGEGEGGGGGVANQPKFMSGKLLWILRHESGPGGWAGRQAKGGSQLVSQWGRLDFGLGVLLLLLLLLPCFASTSDLFTIVVSFALSDPRQKPHMLRQLYLASPVVSSEEEWSVLFSSFRICVWVCVCVCFFFFFWFLRIFFLHLGHINY
jgi:hypothetical protein